MGTVEQIAEVYRPYDLDVIGFTEVPKGDWTARAATALGMEYFCCGTLSSGGEMHDWGVNKYKAIVSRFPLGRWSDVYPKEPSDWLNGSATRAAADCNGTRVAVYSLHIPGRVEEDSVAENLGRWIDAHEETVRVVAMGDYNDSPGSAGLRAFESFGMKSAWVDLGIAESIMSTYPANVPDPPSRSLIDHIYYRGRARTIDGGAVEPDPPLSDHKPVWAVIEFQG